MQGFLEKILENKRREVAARKKRFPLHGLPPVREPGRFKAALAKPGISIIAEFKRKSPSAGSYGNEADPVRAALEYEQNGADAVSILTDFTFFGGSMEDLTAVKQAVLVPVLRKDFIIDSYQVLESRRGLADAVLLIVKTMDDSTLDLLLGLAAESGLDALVEVHDETELDRALKAGAGIIGVNNRELQTFQTDIRTSIGLAKHIPEGRIKVSESGIKSSGDVRRLEEAGFDAVLIGGALLESGDAGRALRGLRGIGS
jgi:indole-3-glycerol phosphate synthase